MAHRTHHVWIVVPALVREDRGQVGHLQRCDQHFALPDAHAVDGAEGPTLLSVLTIVVGHIGDIATLCGRQVYRQPLPKPKVSMYSCHMRIPMAASLKRFGSLSCSTIRLKT
jgi:hypothetical protein